MDFTQNKDFQAIVEILASLEHQLGEINQIQLQDVNGFIQQVEEHFQKCIKSLVDRKNSLINQLQDISQKQETKISKMKEDLSACIESCQDMQTAGIKVFKTRPNNAAQIWQGALSLDLPNFNIDWHQFLIEIHLPDSLLETIVTYGTVKPADSITKEAIDLKNINTTLVIPFQEFENVLEREKNLNNLDLTTNWDSSDSSSLSTSSGSHSQLTQTSAVSSPTTVNEFYEVDMVSTFAGSSRGLKDESGRKAQFNNLIGICFNPSDECIYICDSWTIRKMTLQGVVSTLVNVKGFTVEITVYEKENTLFATCGHCIIKISLTGQVEVLAGDFVAKGYKDGVGPDARFSGPSGIAIDQKTGIIFVSEPSIHSIRTVTQKGVVSTKQSRLNFPCGICFDEFNQSLLVCDRGNNRIIRVAQNGEVSMLCKLTEPQRITTCNGKFLISSQNKIFQLAIKGAGESELREIAGSGKKQTVDGNANECSFNNPRCMAVNEAANACFVTDLDSGVIRKITFK